MLVISRAQIQQVFRAHGLGDAASIEKPSRRPNSATFVVNERYVLRISLERPARFLTAQRAYSLLQGSGVPVPQVIILDTSAALIPYEYMVLLRMPGRSLPDAWDAYTAEERAAAAREAGEMLARLHSVRLSAFGGLLSGDRFQTAYEQAIHHLAHHVAAALQTRYYTPRMNEQLALLLEACRPSLQRTAPRLVHSDDVLANLLTENGRITGISDMEWAMGSDPAWDFRGDDQWEAQCHGSRQQVYAGYQALRQLDPHHSLKARLYRALQCVEQIARFPDLRGRAVERFNRLFDSPGALA